jgi:hypothetical protein
MKIEKERYAYVINPRIQTEDVLAYIDLRLESMIEEDYEINSFFGGFEAALYAVRGFVSKTAECNEEDLRDQKALTSEYSRECAPEK